MNTEEEKAQNKHLGDEVYKYPRSDDTSNSAWRPAAGGESGVPMGIQNRYVGSTTISTTTDP